MTRPSRLLATSAIALALALGVSIRFVRAEQPSADPGAVDLATRGVAGPATRVAAAGPSTLDADLLAYKSTGGKDKKEKDADEDYRLDRLNVLGRVIHFVYQAYVDPTRVDPKGLVLGALDAVERQAAEVMVKGDAKSDTLSVTVGAAQKDFEFKDIDTIWRARVLLGEVMGFVQEHLVTKQDLRELEYAAANGMLGTLDPHSTLMRSKYAKEMRLTTVGEFGGVGFSISMIDGNLTVKQVFKGFPAHRAGIKVKDVIVRIGERSTVNMDLDDAVDRLRGKPGTTVAISVSRAGKSEPQALNLVREIIPIVTVVQAKLLDGGVGYLRISEFKHNTTRDVEAALAQQRAQAGGKLKGLILDLRGNPGGLLQEAIKLSDLFLASGVIVKQVSEGGSRRRDVAEATSDKSDLVDLPLVVLVNSGSASASEIVAGALKNNNRALIVGRQTFGKGSVQQLFDFPELGRPDEEASLKLTTAQYLTPGDISIQEVGITPDVALQPGRALKDQVNVFAPPRLMGEADLDRHLTNFEERGKDAAVAAADAKRKRAMKPALELRYLLDEGEDAVAKALKAEAAREAHADEALADDQAADAPVDADPDQVKEDYQMRFSRELLVRAPLIERSRLLEAATTMVEERRREEEKRLEARLGQLGVDWAAGPAKVGGAPRAVVTVDTGARTPRAGETMRWSVTVENRGDAPFRRLRAWSSAERSGLLDRREFVFGTVRPGERRTWTVPVRLPRSLDSRRDEVVLHFEDDRDQAPPDVTTMVDLVEVARPAFAVSVQVDDRKGGNGDGLPARGESFTLRIDVHNAGAGPAGEKTFVSLKNLGDEKVFIKKGHEVLGALKAGETRAATMEVELKAGAKLETLPLRVAVYDEKSGEYVAEKVELAVAAGADPVTAEAGAVRAEAADVLIRGGAAVTAPVVATARKGAVLPTTGNTPGWRRVEWRAGRFGFVASGDVVSAKGARGGVVTEAWQREPPRFTLSPDPARGAPVVDAETFRLTGQVLLPPSADPDVRIRDVYVYVNDAKTFFKLVGEGTEDGKVEFATELKLKPGLNVVTVFAREDEEYLARRSLVIFRRTPPAVAETGAPGGGATRTP